MSPPWRLFSKQKFHFLPQNSIVKGKRLKIRITSCFAPMYSMIYDVLGGVQQSLLKFNKMYR